MKRWLILFLALGLVAGLAPASQAGERKKGERVLVPGFPTQLAYVFIPEKFDKEKAYPLFLAFRVHASNEQYGFGWGDLADEADCIVAAMNLATTGYWWYSSTYKRDKPHERIASLCKSLSRKYKLASRMFIATEEEAARVIQTFAFAFPKRVAGVSIHDPDHLANIQWNTPKIPTLVTCSANSSWSMRKIERFLDDARRNDYRCIYFEVIPGGYTDQEEGKPRELTVQFFKRCIGHSDAAVPKEVVERVKKAGELAQIGEYAEAVELLKPVAESDKCGQYGDKAKELLKQIEGEAGKKLQAADKIAEDDQKKATAMYQDIAKRFKGTAVASKAQAKLKDLGVVVSTDPDKPEPEKPVQPEPEPDKPEPDKPVKPEPDKPEPEPDKPKTTEPKPDRRAESWLQFARNFIENERYDQAKVYLRRIIAKYPDSPQAAEAKILMERCR